MKSLPIVTLLALLFGVARADLSGPLSTLGSVGPEGKGNAEAAEAWREITAAGTEAILPTLQAMDGAAPLARNWMRTAVETVFHEAIAGEKEVPAEGIRTFLLDRDEDPDARRLALDLYRQLSEEEAAALVPDMIDDPATPLRREAVALAITEAKAELAGGDKEASSAILRETLAAARDVDQIDAIAKLLREDLGETVDLPKQFGFLMRWHMAAPFDNTDRAGFAEVYPPETGSVDLSAKYPGKDEAEIAWQEYATSDDHGKVDFNQPFGPQKQVVGYAFTTFRSDEERDAQLRLGCKNAWKIWFNGEFVFGRDEYHRGQRIDQYILPVKLKKGENTILVKACQNEQEQDWTVQWEFQLRVTDPAGTAILSTDRQPTPQPEAPSRRPGTEQ